jgi:flagellar basal-body rod modification protein FlgD
MSTSFSALGPSTTNASTPSASNTLAATDPLANENTFLQLLVAQIQNQDPTQPVDSSTFLTQLAEFSQLEQLIQINQNTSNLDPASSSTSGASGSPGSQGTSGTQS